MRAPPPLGLAALLIIGFVGCAESPTGGSEPPGRPPLAPPSALTILRGTADLARGTLDFSSVVPIALPGFSAMIYGDQNVTVRLYNSGVVVDSSANPWRWTASVGVRNLLPHFVGDEETGAATLDTMGVFVFFVQDAIPGQPCPGCSAAIGNHDGTLSFFAPNQKFFHWRERLNPAGSPLGDTTLVRRVWRFETSPGVRSFTFNVLVAAAWPPPQETRWRVQYPADSLPGGSAPPWKRSTSGAGGSGSVAGGSLTLTGNNRGSVLYHRRDPIAASQNAYVNATARVTSGAISRPQITILLSDDVKLMALAASRNTVGLMRNDGQFLSGTTSALTNAVHQFQLRKYAADSVVWFVDGARRGRATYASLPNDTYTASSGAYVGFGALDTPSGNTSIWSDVIYEIGVAFP